MSLAVRRWDVRDALGVSDYNITYPAVCAVWGALLRLNHKLPHSSRLGPPKPLQAKGLKIMAEQPFSAVKGERQFYGKTTDAAIVTTTGLLLGQQWGTALPTQRQGTRVPLDRVKNYMTAVCPTLGIKRRRPFNELVLKWDNDAMLAVLSFSESGVEGSEGYTFDGIWMDEGHRALAKHLPYFTALTSRAHLAGRGRFIVTGVWCFGRDKVLSTERCLNDERFGDTRYIEVTDVMLAAEDDRLRAAGDARAQAVPLREWQRREKESSDPQEYQRFHSGPDLDSVFGRSFPELRDEAGQLRGRANVIVDGGFKRIRYGCADIGKRGWRTCLGVFEDYGEVTNIVAVRMLPVGMEYNDQGWEIAAFAQENGVRPEDFLIEQNGPGDPVCDFLRDPARPIMWGVKSVFMTYRKKYRAWRWLRGKMSPHGAMPHSFGVPLELQADGIGNVAQHLSDLRASFGAPLDEEDREEEEGVNDGDRWHWEKSDVFSMLLVGAHVKASRVVSG